MLFAFRHSESRENDTSDLFWISPRPRFASALFHTLTKHLDATLIYRLNPGYPLKEKTTSRPPSAWYMIRCISVLGHQLLSLLLRKIVQFACVCSQIGTHVSNLCNATTMHNSMSLIQLTVLHLKVSKLLNICSTLIVECMHILAPAGSGAGTPIYSQWIVTF